MGLRKCSSGTFLSPPLFFHTLTPAFSLYITVSDMAHVLVYYTLLVVIIICIVFVKLRKCWRM